MKITLTILFTAILAAAGYSQSCTPLGNQTTYGTGNIWIGYVYQGSNFDTYKGYVNEGSAASSNFDESFGGSGTNYSTNGCFIYTDVFSVRYKLTQTVVDGDYTITVGGDDGFRLSVDGGSTWIINQWVLQGYTTTSTTIHLNGTYNMVLEYYENTGENRVSFNMVKNCTGSGDPTIYGVNNQWIGYIYSGTNFNTYKGFTSEGSSLSPNFDEGFGGDNVSYGTSDCPINTQSFSVRYRLKKSFSNGVYKFDVGGDDGYRLSLDGGSTWVINNWSDHSYSASNYSTSLSGTYNMVLEYYENGGQNRITMAISGGSILPITITQFNGESVNTHDTRLVWNTIMEAKVDYFNIQRSTDGVHFENIGQVESKMTSTTNDYELNYDFTDADAVPGTSYYRLQIVDRNGFSNYSDVIHISNKTIEGIKIYPTVINNTNLFVETDKSIKNAKLEFFDMTGKKIGETNWENLNGRQSLQPVSNMNSLATGTYVARLSSHGETILSQLLIFQKH